MASYQYVYHMDGVSKTYPGGKKCFENIRLNFLPGVKIGVVGVNGAGKSTLLRIMAGIDKDFQGEAWAAKGAKVGYLSQEPQLDETLSVRENVMLGVAEKTAKIARYNDLAMNYSDETADEMARLQDEIDAENLWDLDSQVDIALEALRCPPDDANVATLSGGERRRVALCKLLLEAPDMLLLDEPTNHLDAETIAWLQKHLIDYKGTILCVTHDRYFLDDITSWILELERGRGIPYEGNYSAWLEQKAKRLEQEAREDKAKQKVMEKELEWIRAGAKARQAKSKARIAAYDKMAEEGVKERVGKAQIIIPNGPRLGGKVIEVEGLKKHMGDKLLIENLSFSLPPGGIMGVIGPNGAGKSTLIKMIIGQEAPDEGTIIVGDTVKLAYVDQSRDALDAEKNVWEEISGGAELIQLGDATVASRSYVGAFNFKGADQQKKVGQLSGGERNRVHMAKLLKSGGNVLLLDEPTNDLDVETLQALEAAIEDFAGCAVIISHDRFFLDRLCTHILSFEGDAHVEFFEGNFEDYENDKIRRLGPDAVEPKRVKYKKFTR
ncbi:energy-dependent translational throttle protein EttA [Rhodobacter capsulatus]|uniref:Energy-dependent translational throttle protein EttA n=1 Tax=Rhodobacter capsulatus TaxID=1061 RepID=A0A0Q0UH66_RHOCA|nr:energy-dependent translational throttle protein EttA [Rhodobacter capsulatus]KQB12811.1 ABC transporter ATP-binding protein [Rhodobacter capsulatus]KQB13141.1 ABC transporter ATP-binding protein [Rhodobacter capsulatus]PZX28593.1 ATP-binding cassette ChvD family protein [Rhodobacter capsulatus]QNR62869.1 energy-dependent translational throttle protein EttA [Rhodobacter capsulatus]WER08951.1 energy-dependent translational throttle protein EttA [Rhodobacter capsulatus]